MKPMKPVKRAPGTILLNCLGIDKHVFVVASAQCDWGTGYIEFKVGAEVGMG